MKHGRFCLYVEHFLRFRVFFEFEFSQSCHTCTRTELTFETCLSKEREARLFFYIAQARGVTLKKYIYEYKHKHTKILSVYKYKKRKTKKNTIYTKYFIAPSAVLSLLINFLKICYFFIYI